jgi:hypothetical protein
VRRERQEVDTELRRTLGRNAVEDARAYRFAVSAKLNEPVELKIEEEQSIRQGFAITNLNDDAIRIYLAADVISEPVKQAFAAFEKGVHAVKPQAVVTTTYLGSWNDANAGKEQALALIRQGADFIFPNADAAGNGVFQAVQENASKGVLAFGALSAASPLAALSPFSDLEPFCVGWACCALSPFSGRGAFSDLSGLPDFSGFLPLVSVSAIDLNS